MALATGKYHGIELMAIALNFLRTLKGRSHYRVCIGLRLLKGRSPRKLHWLPHPFVLV